MGVPTGGAAVAAGLVLSFALLGCASAVEPSVDGSQVDESRVDVPQWVLADGLVFESLRILDREIGEVWIERDGSELTGPEFNGPEFTGMAASSPPPSRDLSWCDLDVVPTLGTFDVHRSFFRRDEYPDPMGLPEINVLCTHSRHTIPFVRSTYRGSIDLSMRISTLVYPASPDDWSHYTQVPMGQPASVCLYLDTHDIGRPARRVHPNVLGAKLFRNYDPYPTGMYLGCFVAPRADVSTAVVTFHGLRVPAKYLPIRYLAVEPLPYVPGRFPTPFAPLVPALGLNIHHSFRVEDLTVHYTGPCVDKNLVPRIPRR